MLFVFIGVFLNIIECSELSIKRKETMKKLIPDFIAERYRQNELSGKMQAATMFLDISGFTPMTERLMREGKEGAEVLSVIINDIFNPVIDSVYESGGFVSTFAGDAFTSIFPDVKNTCGVLKCACEIIDIFNETGRQNTKFGEFDLFVKLGLSYGEVEWQIIGNHENKSYCFRGDAIDSCARCEHHCEKSDIVLDDKILSIAGEEKIQTVKLNDTYHKLTGVHKSESYLEKDMMKERSISREVLEKFVPKQIITLSQKGEFREIVSVFISFKESKDKRELNYLIGEIITNAILQGGYFNKMDFGDKGGVSLVLFGAPVSHEDNLTRALNFITQIRNDFKEDIRAGITMGIAYCGMVGSDRRCEYTALGDTVNQSARFMMKADWGDIWISEFVSKKITERYDFQDLGKMEFKGKKDQIRVYGLQKKNTNDERGFFSGEMIGRKKELALLKDSAAPLRKNKFAGIVYVYGEAGMGKSRLVYEFTRSVSEYHVIVMRTDNILKISMNPFKYFLHNYFNQLTARDKETKKKNFEEIYGKLLADLADLKDSGSEEIISELKRTKSIISSQLEIFYENSLYEHLDPKGRYENTVFAYKEFFKGLSLIKPLIIQIEDIHWLDEDSHKVFQTLCRLIDDFPIMILATGRFNDDGSKPSIKVDKGVCQREIILDRLEEESASAFVELQLEGEADSELLQLINDKTEFNPFYIEQFICYLKESELLVLEDNLYRLKSTGIEIPGTVSAIIIARIDRLESELKNIVQIASVLGREVELEVLMNLLHTYQNVQDKKQITVYLAEIENEQIWSRLAEIKYIFRHALLHEAVYEMQLKGRIRELHNLAARSIRDIYEDNEEKHYEIANHYDKAENFEQAACYYRKAGEYHKKNYENIKAIECLDRYLTLAQNIDADETDILQALRSKGGILELIGRWDEAQEIYEKCVVLTETSNDGGSLGECKCDLGNLIMNRGRYEEAMELFEQAKTIAENIDDKMLLANVVKNMGFLYCDKADYGRAMRCHEEQKRICLELGDKKNYSTAVGSMGIVFKNQGGYEKAMCCYEEQKRICLELGDKKGYSIASANMGVVYMNLGEYEKAMQCHEEGKRICLELGCKQNYSIAIGNIGNLHYLQGEYEKAMHCYDEQKQICLELNHKMGYLVTVGNMGMIYLKQGNYEKTMWCYDEVIKTDRELELKSYLCEDLQYKADLLFILKDFENAKSLNDEANQTASEVRRKDIIFSSTILDLKLHALKNPDEAVSKLKQLLYGENEAENTALIHYEIHKINKSVEHRQKALESYYKLLEKIPKQEYEDKIAELNGEKE